jgi:hypothetical protein
MRQRAKLIYWPTIISRIARDAAHAAVGSAAVCNSQQQGRQRGGTDFCTFGPWWCSGAARDAVNVRSKTAKSTGGAAATAFAIGHSHSPQHRLVDDLRSAGDP